VAKMSSFPFLLRTCLELLRLRLGDCVGLLASVLAILILSAILKAFTSSLGGDGIGKAFSVLATLSILLALLRLGYGGFTAVTDYLAVLEKMTTASIPLLGTLYALGGNVATATASTAGLSVFLSVLQPFVGKSILPFCGVCLAFSTVNALEPSLRTGTLLGTLKKNYTTLLAFLMMLLLAMLSAQTVLGARGDTLAMRSAKFAASNLIPVVGGSVSELLRTVSASVGYLRGTVGICAVLLLLLALLPTLTELLLLRLSWQICASAADLLSCDTEKKLLDEIASLNGYLIAAVSICSSVLFLALSLLIYCASALE
jgi:stage III sporulation protein AE